MRAIKTRVFLVDDHEIVRESLTRRLERTDDLEVVGEASNVHDALRGICNSSPDVVVVDLQLGTESGVAICEAIRVGHPRTRSMILTGMSDHSFLMAAIAAGASGYVDKLLSLSSIVDAIRSVAAGETMLATAAEISVSSSSRVSDTNTLSDQEERVLELVAAGFTNQQTAHRLNIANQTVKNHVSKVLKKLGLESRTQAAVYVAQHRSRGS